jgi:hypothetical protein
MSPWNQGVCNDLLEKYFCTPDHPPRYAENILRLLQQLLLMLSTFRDWPHNHPWGYKYIKHHTENLQAKFIHHCDRQEWPVAALLLDILRMVSITIATLI